MDERELRPRPVFGARECLMLPAALCLGILWQEVFTAEGLANLVFGNRPGCHAGRLRPAALDVRNARRI